MQRLAFLIVFCSCLLSGNAFGKMLTVEADEMQKTLFHIEARGNVVVTGDDLMLKADYVFYDTSTEDIWATGDCILKDAKGEVNASSLYYNARRKDMHIKEGWVLIYAQPTKISGQSITRYGEDYYTGQSVEYTPCLGMPPDWSIKADELEIPVGGYAGAKDARFNIDTWPIIRVPYLPFPAMLNRHSGLLFPEMSHGSDYGYRFGIPAYIVLGRSLDATVTPTWLSRRGLLMKNELRYALDYDQSGLIYLETLHDRMGGGKSDGGIVQKIPDDRWFLKTEQSGGNLNWDVNLVSNADYFRDIGTFYKETFHKAVVPTGEINQLDDSKLNELISRMEWADSFNGFSASLSGQWKQDLTREDNGKTFQELPALSVRMRERSVPYTPLMASAEISSIRVHTLDWIDARKDNGNVEVSWPLSIYPYFTFRPYMKEIYRNTFFSERKDLYPDSAYEEHWEERGASLSTTLYSLRFAGGLYHQVVPEISWKYQSRYGGNYVMNNLEDTFPQLLTGDDWEKTSETGLSLSNYIRDSLGMSLADFTVTDYYSYVQGQWKSIELRANLKPYPWLTASHINTLDREPGRGYATVEHSTRLTLTDTRNDTFSLGGEYHRPDTKLILAGIHAELVKGFSAGFDAKYDSINHEFDSQTQMVGYASQCWSVVAERHMEAADTISPRKTTWYLVVKLLGMGDIFHAGYEEKGPANQ